MHIAEMFSQKRSYIFQYRCTAHHSNTHTHTYIRYGAAAIVCWHFCRKKNLCSVRRKLVGASKEIETFACKRIWYIYSGICHEMQNFESERYIPHAHRERVGKMLEKRFIRHTLILSCIKWANSAPKWRHTASHCGVYSGVYRTHPIWV